MTDQERDAVVRALVAKHRLPGGKLGPGYNEELFRAFGLGKYARTRSPDPLAYTRAVQQLDGGL